MNNNWQPIDTAPAFVPFEENPKRCLLFTKWGIWMGACGKFPDGEVFATMDTVSGRTTELVSHWMPLPEPPTK